MADGSHIEWTDATWNPLVGCTKVSPGCDNCYAEGEVTRRHAAALSPKTSPKMLEAFPAPFSTVSIRPNRFLLQPLAWTKPRRIFVNSLSDLFHADVSDDFIAQVFAVMALAPQHTFQLLTKRQGRMRSLLSDDGFRSEIAHEINGLITVDGVPEPAYLSSYDDWWPLPHVWLGVSVEDQKWAEIRIPALLATPAAVRWISAEPLLGAVTLKPWLSDPAWVDGDMWPPSNARQRTLDWVVVGGESGPGARPMHPDWVRQLRDECAATNRQRGHHWMGGPPTVAFLFKQWGALVTEDQSLQDIRLPSVAWQLLGDRGPTFYRVGKTAAGRELDGRTHDEYPDLEMTHA